MKRRKADTMNPFIYFEGTKELDSIWSNQREYLDLVVYNNNPKHKNKTTKLTDVFTEFPYGLPHGIVSKEETGMGATTLEILSHRNSVIVEPIKITASSKAFEHGALYVGSPTRNFHPNKVEEHDILKYLQSDVKYKKIIVVADSLGKVIKAIDKMSVIERINSLGISQEVKDKMIELVDGVKKSGVLKNLQTENPLDHYFLLIDEIDSFQLDSSYRRSMEECLDYYKMFKPENRCMLSATDILFTDPELQNEKITRISYKDRQKRKIKIITSTDKFLHGNAYDTIIQLVKKYTNDKILIAFNSVSGCYKLAENISTKNSNLIGKIKILCSEQSKDKVGEYYQELDNDTLPAKINFITSAYFTGFDLNERFHLISISGNKSSVQALSERRLKQIAGRCRYELLSETIIHDTVSMPNFKNIFKDLPVNKREAKIKSEIARWRKDIIKKDPSKLQLIKAATEQVKSLTCMNEHYKKNKILNSILEDVNGKFMKILDEKGMRYIRRDRQRNFKISYLNIDAKLESIRVKQELYLNYRSLTEKLKSHGHNVTSKWIDINTISKLEDVKISNEVSDKKIRYVIRKLKAVKSDAEIDPCFANDSLNVIQKTVVRDFKSLYGYLNQYDILKKMEKALIGKRDSREYNSLLVSARIQTLPKGHIIIDRLNYHFKPKTQFSAIEILQKMNQFLIETGNIKQIKSPSSAVQLLNKFRKTYRKQVKKQGPVYYRIQNNNPRSIKCLRRRAPLSQMVKYL